MSIKRLGVRCCLIKFSLIINQATYPSSSLNINRYITYTRRPTAISSCYERKKIVARLSGSLCELCWKVFHFHCDIQQPPSASVTNSGHICLTACTVDHRLSKDRQRIWLTVRSRFQFSERLWMTARRNINLIHPTHDKINICCVLTLQVFSAHSLKWVPAFGSHSHLHRTGS